MNATNSNRNESFINTASKLLEKAKQNHLNQMDETNNAKPSGKSTEFIQTKSNVTILYKTQQATNEELIPN